LPAFKNKNLRDPGPQAFGFLTRARAVFPGWITNRTLNYYLGTLGLHFRAQTPGPKMKKAPERFSIPYTTPDLYVARSCLVQNGVLAGHIWNYQDAAYEPV